MKTGRTLQDLAEELKRQDEAKRDFISDTRNMTVNVVEREEVDPTTELIRKVPVPILTMEADDALESFGFKPTAHSQVASKLAIPSKYYHRMLQNAPGLWKDSVNHWLHEEPEKRMVRTLDDNARAFLSSSYRRLDNFDMAKQILPMVARMRKDVGTECTSCEVTDDYLHLKFIHTLLEGEVGEGDVVQAGFAIRNSEVGKACYEVSFFLMRLVCLNGMKMPFGFKKVHLGRKLETDSFRELFSDRSKRLEDATVYSQTKDVVRALATKEKFEETLELLEASSERKISGDVPGAVEVLRKKEGLTQDEGSDVLRHLIEGGDLSAWGMANAVTRLSQDVDDYDRATDLEGLGGKLVLLNDKEWRTIAEASPSDRPKRKRD